MKTQDRLARSSPTTEFYQSLQIAFDFFNLDLFGGLLPPCLITLRSCKGCYGYHHGARFIAKNGDLLDEIGLNPGFFSIRPVEVTLSTLVHEMTHHWQTHFGKLTPSNPHNSEWVSKMEEVGLRPSETGLPGGGQTGKKVTHFILPDGKFIVACKKLIESSFEISWFDRHAPAEHDLFTKQSDSLEKLQMRVPLSELPVSEIAQPKQKSVTHNKPQSTATIYSPMPKREYKRLRMWCPNCKSKITLASEIHLICGRCKVDLEILN